MHIYIYIYILYGDYTKLPKGPPSTLNDSLASLVLTVAESEFGRCRSLNAVHIEDHSNPNLTWLWLFRETRAPEGPSRTCSPWQKNTKTGSVSSKTSLPTLGSQLLKPKGVPLVRQNRRAKLGCTMLCMGRMHYLQLVLNYS